jgi:hypothetical protein
VASPYEHDTAFENEVYGQQQTQAHHTSSGGGGEKQVRVCVYIFLVCEYIESY